MTCGSCVNKWKEYYVKKGFSAEKAEIMAFKLVNRVEKRLAREHKDYEPMYLIEKAGEGIDIIRRKPSRSQWISYFLRQWILKTNWKATLLYSLMFKRAFWIGKGGNSPYDYTLPCGSPITGTCNNGAACSSAVTCYSSTACQSCNCPSPLSNSTLTTNLCVGQYSSGCVCSSKKCIGTPVCGACLEFCEYTCSPGYVWNGSACVLPSVAQKNVGDGLTWVTQMLRRKPKLRLSCLKHLNKNDVDRLLRRRR
jgi:hypothetical protein